MRQEVEIIVKFTLDVDAKLDKNEIKAQFHDLIEISDTEDEVNIVTYKTLLFREEVEIYGSQ